MSLEQYLAMKHLYLTLAILFLTHLFSCSSQDTSSDIEPINNTDSIAQSQRIGIKMHKIGGVYEIPCIVNGLKMNFIFDTGASNVTISLTEALFMYRNGYITDADLGGTQYSTIANGEIVANMQVNLKTIEIEGIVLEDVSALVVASMNAPLLLGQSAIQRIGKIEIDNDSLFITNIPKNTKRKVVETKGIDLLPAPKITWWDKMKIFFGKDSKIDELLNAAKNAYGNDMIELAERYCEQAKDLSEKNWKPYAYLGYIRAQNNYYIDAVNNYKSAIEYNKKHKTLYFNDGDSISYQMIKERLAWQYVNCIDYERRKDKYKISSHQSEGLEYIQNLLVEQPKNKNIVNSLSYYYTITEEYDLAEKWANKLLELNESEGYFRLAYLEQRRENNDKAIEYYEKVLELDPQSSGAMNNLANLLWEKKYDSVIYGYEKKKMKDVWGKTITLNEPLTKYVKNNNYYRAIDLKKRAARLGDDYAQKWLKEQKIEW